MKVVRSGDAVRQHLRFTLAAAARRWIRLLPARTRNYVVGELAREVDAFGLLGSVARDLGFCGLMASGSSGTVIGNIDDRAALLRYARDGYWAPHQREVFEQLFRPCGGTYIDIGANIGLTVIPIARDQRVTCHAFEPEPNNFGNLTRNVSINCKWPNVHLYNVALFDADTTVSFELSSHHSGDHRISPEVREGALGEQHRLRIPVPARRLDTAITDFVRPLGVKIDTQGAEPFVIRGGENLLREADVLALEFWPYSIKRIGGDISVILDFLQQNFHSGSAAIGDRDTQPHWEDILHLARRLGDFGAKYHEATNYLDVIVRKRGLAT